MIVPFIEPGKQEHFLRKLRRRQEVFMAQAEETVRPIIQDVASRGDKALLSWTHKLDGIRLRPGQIRIGREEIHRLSARVPESLRMAFEKAIFQVNAFHRRQKPQSWEFKAGDARLGQRVRPLDSVGIYVPGGRAAYPSTILMAAIPAKVAAVPRVVAVTPPGNLENHPELAAVLAMVGIQEVYQVGGSQAIAALAYGTKTIPPVDKIVGPGNAYVAAAKRLVFGKVGIDMIAGPTEVVVVADQSVPPDLIAADLLSQAEHDVLASAICITNSKLHAVQIDSQLARQLKDLPKGSTARESLRNFGAVIVVENRSQAAELVNRLAPEHLELLLEDARDFSLEIRHAGAIFFGLYSPEAAGDYVAGPSHILPTSGTARFSSPLGVQDFVKTSSLIEYGRRRLQQDRGAIEQIAEVEGLAAHARSVKIRFKE